MLGSKIKNWILPNGFHFQTRVSFPQSTGRHSKSHCKNSTFLPYTPEDHLSPFPDKLLLPLCKVVADFPSLLNHWSISSVLFLEFWEIALFVFSWITFRLSSPCVGCECARVWEGELCCKMDVWTFFTTSLDPLDNHSPVFCLDEVTVNEPVEHLWESEYHVWVLPASLDVTDQSNLYHGLSGLRSGAPLPLHQGGATNQPTNPLWAPLPPVILHLDLLLDISLCSFPQLKVSYLSHLFNIIAEDASTFGNPPLTDTTSETLFK